MCISISDNCSAGYKDDGRETKMCILLADSCYEGYKDHGPGDLCISEN